MCMSGESGGAHIALGAAIRLMQAGHGDKVRALFVYDPMVSYMTEKLDPSMALECEKSQLTFARQSYELLATDYEK